MQVVTPWCIKTPLHMLIFRKSSLELKYRFISLLLSISKVLEVHVFNFLFHGLETVHLLNCFSNLGSK